MNNDNLRLIANPYLLKKNNNDKKIKDHYLYNLEDLINKKYKIQIDKELLKDINLNIDNKIIDYKREKFIKNFVNECIENAIKNLINK